MFGPRLNAASGGSLRRSLEATQVAQLIQDGPSMCATKAGCGVSVASPAWRGSRSRAIISCCFILFSSFQTQIDHLLVMWMISFAFLFYECLSELLFINKVCRYTEVKSWSFLSLPIKLSICLTYFIK